MTAIPEFPSAGEPRLSLADIIELSILSHNIGPSRTKLTVLINIDQKAGVRFWVKGTADGINSVEEVFHEMSLILSQSEP